MRQTITLVRLDVEDLAVQRNALQARIDAYEGKVEQWEEMDRLIRESSLGSPEAQEYIRQAPTGVGMAIVRASELLGDNEELDELVERMRPVVEAAEAFVDADDALDDETDDNADALYATYLTRGDDLAVAVKRWRTDPRGDASRG